MLQVKILPQMTLYYHLMRHFCTFWSHPFPQYFSVTWLQNLKQPIQYSLLTLRIKIKYIYIKIMKDVEITLENHYHNFIPSIQAKNHRNGVITQSWVSHFPPTLRVNFRLFPSLPLEQRKTYFTSYIGLLNFCQCFENIPHNNK